MKIFKNKNNKGISILGILLLGVIIILILSYFQISIRGIVESPEARDNFGYVHNTSKTFWDRYLREPASYVWNQIFINLFWNSFVSNMERIRDGQPTDFELAAPSALPPGN